MNFSAAGLALPLALSFTPLVAVGGEVELTATVIGPTPEILAYNSGHFFPGSNTHDWWRYARVNGARFFVSPTEIEPEDDIPGRGDGVTTQASFVARRSALSADPLNPSFIDWPDFEDEFANNTLGNSSSGNRIRVDAALEKLGGLGIDSLIQITLSEKTFPIADGGDWAGKWELWQHFYAQAFHLARHHDVTRFQMYNEPDHPNAQGLTPENWLMRLQLASDAAQLAIADVNRLYQKSLSPLIYGPVSAGTAYEDWGKLAIDNRHVNFLGQSDPDFLLLHRYDYHKYNSSPSRFGSALATLQADIAMDMAPEATLPTAITEFNVHTNGTYQTMPETPDDPGKFSRFGAICINLAANNEAELYCFKFSLTKQLGSNYGVKKNGMHYVQNEAAPYDIGGATGSAEVWRLFNKALAPGGQRLATNEGAGGAGDALEVIATHDAGSGNYYVLSANDSDRAVALTLDTSLWNLPAGARYLLEEVSTERLGSGRAWQTSLSGTSFSQPARSVWLFTIPDSAQQAEVILSPSANAMVVDGSNAETNYGNVSTILVRNEPTTPNQRAVAFTKFNLPVIHLPDIQLATLHFPARTRSSTSDIQAHVYGSADDSWDASQLTWNNAPHLLKNRPAGVTIADRVVTGQGENLFIQGQVLVRQPSERTQIFEVTDFLRKQVDGEASFLVSQDPRWDVALPELSEGDPQLDGLLIGTSGLQLRLSLLADSDRDGISDHAETTFFMTDPGVADSDNDGQDDGVEIFAGSDPGDAASLFGVSTFTAQADGGLLLTWDSIPHRTYVVEHSATLQSGDWETIHSASGTGGPLSFSSAPGAGNSRGFYRIKISY